MTRLLLVAVLCVAFAGCGGDDSDDNAAPNAPPPSNDSSAIPEMDFDPTAMTLDMPPTNGELPAELVPPA